MAAVPSAHLESLPSQPVTVTATAHGGIFRVVVSTKTDQALPLPSAEENTILANALPSLEVEANRDFSQFISKYFLDDQGRPDREKTKDPISFELHDRKGLPAMWGIVKEIKGLVLLRQDAFRLMIGWESAMLQPTINSFKKREPLHIRKYNLQAAQLNCEPKYFFRQNLGVDLDGDTESQSFGDQRELKVVTLNKSNLLYQSILEDVQKREPRLTIRESNGIAFIGWIPEQLSIEQKRLKASRALQKVDIETESRHLAKYWSNRAAYHEGKNHTKYLWACHNALRAKITHSPIRPPVFNFSKLPGTYIAKITWNNLKPEFQFPGWDSNSPTSKFSCQGREPEATEMKLHILAPDSTSTHPAGQLTGKFHFGIIEGIMILSLLTPAPSEKSTSVAAGTESHVSTSTTSEERNASPPVGTGRVNRATRKRYLNETEGGYQSEEEPQAKRHKRNTTPPTHANNTVTTLPSSTNNLGTQHHIDSQRKKHVVQFQMFYRSISGTTGEIPGSSSSSVGVHIGTTQDQGGLGGHGKFVYYDGDPKMNLGAKGYFECPAVADGTQKISIYRVCEDGPLDGYV